MSQLSTCFDQNKFCILLEYLTSIKDILPVSDQLADFPVLMTFADRVHSDDDVAPLIKAELYPKQIEKVLHYAGKDRDIQDFEDFLTQAEVLNYSNLLLLTGDKLKSHHQSHGSDIQMRTRYLESVNAVIAAKQRQYFCIGVAFNPFKYVEAEKDAQYFKLHKKIKAGADYIITQLGYDFSALKYLQKFLEKYQYLQKLLACVMPLTLARANFMIKNKVAGITITPHMLNVLKQEKDANITENIYSRCALQILICQHLGFAGVHLSACHQQTEQKKLEQYIEKYRLLNLAECEALWNKLWQIQKGDEFQPQVEQYSHQPTSGQILKYQQLHIMHDAIFDSKIGKGIGKFIFDHHFWSKKTAAKLLLKTELMSKHSIVGCESCGQCRLGETLYICPETCPKGLANGPCGGTTLDLCEFGDRECIHSVKVRLAKAVDQTDILKNKLIPTVPIQVRGSSSWKNWYTDDAI